MKKFATPKFASVQQGQFESSGRSSHARPSSARETLALLASWRARLAWFVLMTVLLYWLWW